jgi:heat shock protein HslJ
MNKTIIARVVLALAIAAAAPALAKKAKPAPDAPQKQEQEQPQGETPPRYQPFPHNQIFNLLDVNGKTPPKEMWMRIDSTGRANGSSGCKNWSGVFVVGQDLLGPRAMPAFTEAPCGQSELAFEREFWGILLTGPYWELKGDQLIIKGVKGGLMRFQRSL